MIFIFMKYYNKLNDLICGFDAVSQNPSAMWYEKSIYPRIETGDVFTKDMKNEVIEKFNKGKFIQRSAIFKIKV